MRPLCLIVSSALAQSGWLLKEEEVNAKIEPAKDQVLTSCEKCKTDDKVKDINAWIACEKENCQGTETELIMMKTMCISTDSPKSAWFYVGKEGFTQHPAYFEWRWLTLEADDASKCKAMNISTGIANSGNAPADCAELIKKYTEVDAPKEYPVYNPRKASIVFGAYDIDFMKDTTKFDTIKVSALKADDGCKPKEAPDVNEANGLISLKSVWTSPIDNTYKVPDSQVEQCDVCKLKSQDAAGFADWVACFEKPDLPARCSHMAANIELTGYTCTHMREKRAVFKLGPASSTIPSVFKVKSIQFPVGDCTAATIGIAQAAEADSETCHTPSETNITPSSLDVAKKVATLHFTGDAAFALPDATNAIVSIDTTNCDVGRGIATLTTEYITPSVEDPTTTEHHHTLDPHQFTEASDAASASVYASALMGALVALFK